MNNMTLFGSALGDLLSDPNFNASLSDITTDLVDLKSKLVQDKDYLADSPHSLIEVIEKVRTFSSLPTHQCRDTDTTTRFRWVLEKLEEIRDRRELEERIHNAIQRSRPETLRQVAEKAINYLSHTVVGHHANDLLKELES